MIEDQFEPIATEYSELENDKTMSRYELEVNWPSIVDVLPGKPATILDYGCGSGLYARKLKNDGYDVYASDNAPSMVAQLSDFGDHALQWTYQDPPLAIMFDVIIAKLVVQFVEDLSAFAKSMWQQLNQDGLLIVSVPHPDRSRPSYEPAPIHI